VLSVHVCLLNDYLVVQIQPSDAYSIAGGCVSDEIKLDRSPGMAKSMPASFSTFNRAISPYESQKKNGGVREKPISILDVYFSNGHVECEWKSNVVRLYVDDQKLGDMRR
jgi:hypothetical protein